MSPSILLSTSVNPNQLTQHLAPFVVELNATPVAGIKMSAFRVWSQGFECLYCNCYGGIAID